MQSLHTRAYTPLGLGSSTVLRVQPLYRPTATTRYHSRASACPAPEPQLLPACARAWDTARAAGIARSQPHARSSCSFWGLEATCSGFTSGAWVVVVGDWVVVVGAWVVVVGAWVVAGGVFSEPVVEPPPLGWAGLGGAGRHCKDGRSSRDNRTSLEWQHRKPQPLGGSWRSRKPTPYSE